MDSRPLPVETVSFTGGCGHLSNSQSTRNRFTHIKEQVGKEKRHKTCLHCPPPTKSFGAEVKTKAPRCAGPTHRQRGRVCSTLKNCAPLNRCTGKTVSTRGRARDCQFKRPLYRCNENVDFAPQWKRHDIASGRMRFSARRQLVS